MTPGANPQHFADGIAGIEEQPCLSPTAPCMEYGFLLPRPAAVTVFLNWPSNEQDLDLFILDNATRSIVDWQAGYVSYDEHMRTELEAGDYLIVVSSSLGTTSTTNGFGLQVWFDEPHGDGFWNAG
jgi:hypothetical protein